MLIYPFTAQSARPTPHESQHKPRSITGRDSYIVAQALFRYIVTEQQKPDDECAWSDLQDTIAIFNAAVGVEERWLFCRPLSPGVTISLVDEKAPRQSFRIDPTARAPKRACAIFVRQLKALPMTPDHHARRAPCRRSRRARSDRWSVWHRQDIAIANARSIYRRCSSTPKTATSRSMTFRSRMFGHRPGRDPRSGRAHRRAEPLIWSRTSLIRRRTSIASADICRASRNVRTVFFDTITAAGRLCFRWASAQPEAFSERTGKPDLRSAYGLHAREFLLALHHLQSARGLNIILIGALETVTDDYGRTEHRLQMEGQRVGREIPGIVDIVITMDSIDFGDGKPVRAFVCTSPNPWGYPAKDRVRKARADRAARSRQADRKNLATAGEPSTVAWRRRTSSPSMRGDDA